jgi:hypothetical protein
MTPEQDEKLVKAFPKLYADRHASMKDTCMCWGFSCGDGWFQLIWDLSEKIEKEINKVEEDSPELKGKIKASQVKEKFGGLRFYMTQETKEISDLISKAEAASERICDVCGKEGDVRNKNGWLSCRCSEHK